MATVTEQTHPGHRWMLEALKLAQNALDKLEVPSKSNEIIDIKFVICLFSFFLSLLFSWLRHCS